MGVTETWSHGGRPGMGKALLISGSEKGVSLMEPLLREIGFSNVQVAGSGGEARRCLADGEYSMVIINAPLKDEMGDELAVWAAETVAAGLMLLIRQEQADEIAAKTEEAGVVVLGKPINRQGFYQSVRLLMAAHRRVQAMMQQNRALQQKLEDLRVVSRAKCLLIERMHITEFEAHRYIEKQAMDQRMTRREVAQEVLETYL